MSSDAGRGRHSLVASVHKLVIILIENAVFSARASAVTCTANTGQYWVEVRHDGE
jgi:hypothetical protein